MIDGFAPLSEVIVMGADDYKLFFQFGVRAFDVTQYVGADNLPHRFFGGKIKVGSQFEVLRLSLGLNGLLRLGQFTHFGAGQLF